MHRNQTRGKLTMLQISLPDYSAGKSSLNTSGKELLSYIKLVTMSVLLRFNRVMHFSCHKAP